MFGFTESRSGAPFTPSGICECCVPSEHCLIPPTFLGGDRDKERDRRKEKKKDSILGIFFIFVYFFVIVDVVVKPNRNFCVHCESVRERAGEYYSMCHSP